MLEIDDDTRLALSDMIVLKALPEFDQYYAFNSENGDHFSLNSTAFWLLQQIGRGSALNTIKREFSYTFGVKRKDAISDISELIHFALENGIVNRRYDDEKETKL